MVEFYVDSRVSENDMIEVCKLYERAIEYRTHTSSLDDQRKWRSYLVKNTNYNGYCIFESSIGLMILQTNAISADPYDSEPISSGYVAKLIKYNLTITEIKIFKFIKRKKYELVKVSSNYCFSISDAVIHRTSVSYDDSENETVNVDQTIVNHLFSKKNKKSISDAFYKF